MTIEPTSDLDILPPARPVQADALTQLVANAQAMQAAKQLADALCDTDMVPAVYKGKPGNGAAAILFGAELGLNPIQSLQNIFVVHGTPAIYARTAVALLKRHGIKFRTIEESASSVTIRAERGDEVEESTWTIERATTAGFTKNGKYQSEPQAMLWAKAAMEVSRRIAPDILLGIAYSSEELEAERPQQVVSRRPAAGRGVDGLRAAIAPAQVVEPEPEPEPEPERKGWAPATRTKWEKALLTALTEADCTDPADIAIVIAELAGRTEPAPVEELSDDELRTAVGKLDAARKENALGSVVTDVLNVAALREADLQA